MRSFGFDGSSHPIPEEIMRRTSLPSGLTFRENVGYGLGDAAANFVFMTMILFQTNFYTDVFGLTAGSAAVVLLIARAWDAVADPLIGFLADRTQTRWGKFRPWILATAAPWALLMILAYTTPSGLSSEEMFFYAVLTNALLMSVYSMNNVPYTALGSVLTADTEERTKLNALRFIAVNLAQLVVGGLTLPLVAKFSTGHSRQYGWRSTMSLWALVCLILFLITFFTTRERVHTQPKRDTKVVQDVISLFRSSPWLVVLGITMVNFLLLSFRGAALYDYYHYYADTASAYRFLHDLGLTTPSAHSIRSGFLGFLDTLGYVVHNDAHGAGYSNVADVFNSLINVINTGVTILILLISPALSRKFGKKTVSTLGFGLAGLLTVVRYVVEPANVAGMLVFTVAITVAYAPTIPLTWAMYADVADYCELSTGRRCAGMAFAGVGLTLKLGLALGSSLFLWIMLAAFDYDAADPWAPEALHGFRIASSLITGALLLLCALLVGFYKLDRTATRRMTDELILRRAQLEPGAS